MSEAGRRYRILEVLGEGGFGRVYKARLEDDQGFAKDVAIKVGNSDSSEMVLKRFRDEARILGLVRDRAVVNVEPPTRLDGRWAVVMEYVEGASLEALLAARSKLPGRVALGIVQEVARALDSVYSAPGPDGGPLEVVHRDLKPANLQITRSGEVKILDFGLARATFSAREADSTTNIGGTLGYIAPERLEGMEGPEGDVYSLGIVLRTLLTGVGPRHWRKFEEEGSTIKDQHELQARALAEDMVNLEPDQRPTAREVEERCVAILGSGMRGPSLRTWALEYVRPSVRTTDPLVGNVLSETLATVPRGIDDSRNLVRGPTSRSMLLVASVGSVGTIALVSLVVLVVLAVGYVVWASETRGPVAVPGTPDIADVLPDEEPAPEPTPEPAPPVEVAPAPGPAPARPRPKPVAASFPVTFDSVPRGAEVFIDGKSLGTTPLEGVSLTGGKHKMRILHGFDATEAQIQVGENAPTAYNWLVGQPLEVRY